MLSHRTSPKLRGAIIGFGFISSKGHLPAYLQRDDVDIIAISDICEERRKVALQTLPALKVYENPLELFENEKDLDFIDISTPPYAHAELTEQALRKGFHVLCEKPLTTSLSSARTMLDEACAAKRVLFPCHNYKHAPVVKAIQNAFKAYPLGKITSVTLNTFRNTHAKGVPEWRTDWRREKRFGGGGIAMDYGSHSFYLMFDWLGSYPSSITAKMNTLHPDRYDTEDNFTASLTFPTGMAHCHLSWTAGVRKVIYTLQAERGAVTVDDDDMQIAVMTQHRALDGRGGIDWKVEKKQIVSNWMDASHVSWFNSLFDQFKEAIHKQQFVSKETIEAYLCVEAITKAYESASSHSIETPISGIQSLVHQPS